MNQHLSCPRRVRREAAAATKKAELLEKKRVEAEEKLQAKEAAALAAKAAKEKAAEAMEKMKLRTVRQQNYTLVMKPLQELQMLLAKLIGEQTGEDDAIEAQAKIDEGEELLKRLAESLQSGQGPDNDEVKEFLSTLKPFIPKMKKLANEKPKK